MKKIICSALVTLIFVSLTASNTPPNGYLGRSVMVGYKAKISHPIVYGQNISYPDFNSHIFLDYSLQDKKAVEAGISYGYLNYNRPNDFGRSGIYSYHNISIDVTYKFYPITGHYSPMGFYVGFGAVFNGMIFKMQAKNENDKLITHKFNKFLIPGIKYTMGRNYVLSNRLLLNVSLDLNFNPVAFFLSHYSGYNEEKITYERSIARQEAFKRLFSANGIQLNIGFGYLVK